MNQIYSSGSPAWARLSPALLDGARLHAFLSGGGLRVVRIVRDDDLIGYGESYHVNGALRRAALDFEAGGRPYGEVYGRRYPHYLTGVSRPNSQLDAWLLRGRTFDVFCDGLAFVVEMRGLRDVKTPQENIDAAIKEGRTTRYEFRGYVYEVSLSHFANGERCASTTIISKPSGRDSADPWMYQIVKRGRSELLREALRSAQEDEGKEERAPQEAPSDSAMADERLAI